MDLTPMHKRVIALDVHQAKITACAVVEHEDGRVEVTKRDLPGPRPRSPASAGWRRWVLRCLGRAHCWVRRWTRWRSRSWSFSSSVVVRGTD